MEKRFDRNISPKILGSIKDEDQVAVARADLELSATEVQQGSSDLVPINKLADSGELEVTAATLDVISNIAEDASTAIRTNITTQEERGAKRVAAMMAGNNEWALDIKIDQPKWKNLTEEQREKIWYLKGVAVLAQTIKERLRSEEVAEAQGFDYNSASNLYSSENRQKELLTEIAPRSEIGVLVNSIKHTLAENYSNYVVWRYSNDNFPEQNRFPQPQFVPDEYVEGRPLWSIPQELRDADLPVDEKMERTRTIARGNAKGHLDSLLEGTDIDQRIKAMIAVSKAGGLSDQEAASVAVSSFLAFGRAKHETDIREVGTANRLNELPGHKAAMQSGNLVERIRRMLQVDSEIADYSHGKDGSELSDDQGYKRLVESKARLQKEIEDANMRLAANMENMIRRDNNVTTIPLAE